MNQVSQLISDMQLKRKTLERQIKAFDSGDKYVSMEKKYKSLLEQQRCKIKKLENELEKAHAQTVSVRNKWQDTCDDIEKETERKLKKKDCEVEKLQQRIWKLTDKHEERISRISNPNTKKNLQKKMKSLNNRVMKSLI